MSRSAVEPVSRDPFAAAEWRLTHGRIMELGPHAVVMGILNVTPDSFSDGGRFFGLESALQQAQRMIAEGAAIIDIGGESTRPNAEPVDEAEEQRRILPVIERLCETDPAIILSVDTWRSATAARAIEAGAHIVNDVHGLQRDPDMASVVAQTGAGLVAMHTGRGRDKLPDVIDDQRAYFAETLARADAAGIARETIMLDPGFGFDKTPSENVDLMRRIAELHSLDHPLLVGTSRKRFLGTVTGRTDAAARAGATAATSALLRAEGAALFRVHDVAINVDALAIADAMREPSLFELRGDA